MFRRGGKEGWRVHEEEQIGQERRQQQASHQELLEVLKVGVVVHAPDTAIRYANPEASLLLGLTSDQLHGRTADDPVWQFVTEDGAPMAPEAFPVNQVLDSQKPLANYVVGIDRPATADRVWVLAHAHPLFGPEQELQSVVVTFVDITARVAAEEALLESERIFAHFMEHSPIYVFFKDENLRAIRLSRNFEKMLGKPLRELIGKSMDELFPSDLAKSMIADDMRIMKEGIPVTVEEELNGGSYSTTKFPIWVDGVPRYLAGFTVDVTQKKHEEREKMELQTQLAQSQNLKSIGRLAGGVAHDFNNMLMAIMGYAELCQDRLPVDDPMHHDLSELRKAAQHSADLTRQLLTFARKQPIMPRALDLNDVIGGALKLLHRVAGKNLKLKWEPGKGLWPVRLDPSQVDHILATLCANARDACPDSGKVVVTSANITLDGDYCAIHRDAVPGDYVRLTVSDDGSGIDSANLEHIFEPFFTTKRFGDSSGMGLATVYGIVKQNNGYIDVATKLNEGTTFEIYLPRFEGGVDPS
jgi:two-component system cell cycle sensor histidine kinase/response regulator CckA